MDLAPNTSAALAVAIAMGAQTRLSRTQTRYEVTLVPEEQRAFAAARTGKGGS